MASGFSVGGRPAAPPPGPMFPPYSRPLPLPPDDAPSPPAAGAEPPTEQQMNTAAAAAAYRLTPASERDPVLEAFLAKHQISPSTSFLMLRLPKHQACNVIAFVNEQLRQAAAGERVPGPSEMNSEETVLGVLRSLGATLATLPKSGSWTSQQRDASPCPTRGVAPSQGAFGFTAGATGSAGSGPGNGGFSISLLPGLNLDSLLGPGFEELLHTVGDDDVRRAREAAATGGLREGSSTAAASGGGGGGGGGDFGGASASCAVRVKNLDKGIREQEMRHLFGRHGEVRRVDMPKDRQEVQGRGVSAIVIMGHPDEAERCIKELNFTKPWGRALIVERLDGSGTVSAGARDGGGCGGGSRGPPAPRLAGVAAPPQRGGGGRQDVGRAARPPQPRGGSRGRSRGARSASLSSGWSRYTLPSKKKKKKKSQKRKRDDSRSSGSDSLSCCTSFSDMFMDGPFGFPLLPGMPVPMALPPGWEGGPLPPPWAAGPPPPPMLDEHGYPVFDMEAAERHLRREERLAKREEKMRRNEPWEDHPARVERRKRGASSGSSSRGPRRGRRRGRGADDEAGFRGNFPFHPGAYPPPPFGPPGWDGHPGMPPGMGMGLPPYGMPPGFPPMGGLPPGLVVRAPWEPPLPQEWELKAHGRRKKDSRRASHKEKRRRRRASPSTEEEDDDDDEEEESEEESAADESGDTEEEEEEEEEAEDEDTASSDVEVVKQE